MNIKPIGKRVIVIEEKVTEKRASGLIIPGNSEEKKVKYGVIEAVGSSVEEVTKGDRILFDRTSGREIESSNGKYILLELEEVLAVVEGEKEYE